MIELRPFATQDLALLRQCNTPAMTAHLGGPETPEALVVRLRRYVEDASPGAMRVIVSNGEAAGSIGYWEHADGETTVWEIGWAVLPTFQGRGIASAAIRAVVDLAAAHQVHQELHAYPSVANEASNALCRKASFVLLGSLEFEYPKGHWMRCNDWSLRLDAVADK
ncbi:MAG: GNAT family protein [Pseudonocardiales bacterium]